MDIVDKKYYAYLQRISDQRALNLCDALDRESVLKIKNAELQAQIDAIYALPVVAVYHHRPERLFYGIRFVQNSPSIGDGTEFVIRPPRGEV